MTLSYSLPAESRHARILQVAPGFSPADAEKLLPIIEWRERLAHLVPIVGRSLVAAPAPLTEMEGIKMKGVGGVLVDAGAVTVVPPEPHRAFTHPPYPQHLAFDHQLMPRIVVERPKAWHSLRLDGAQKSFAMQLALAERGHSLAVYFNGAFLNPDGSPEIDCTPAAAPTGFVVSGFDPNLRTVEVFFDVNGRQFDQQTCSIYRRLGSLRRQTVEDAGLARHASAMCNYLVDPQSMRIYIEDLDTCLNLHDLDPNQRGVQLVRDLSSDIKKIIWDLLMVNPSPEFLETYPYESMLYSYLSQYFPDTASAVLVEDCSIELGQLLKQVLNNFTYQDLCESVAEHATPETLKSRMTIFSGLHLDVHFMHVLIPWVYRLLTHSELAKQFVFPVVDLCEMQTRMSDFYHGPWIDAQTERLIDPTHEDEDPFF